MVMIHSTNKGSHCSMNDSVVTMTRIVDSPQMSSYCPCGKWMNKETLISSLNVLTKQLALWVKLQVLHVKA
jgi:hypothetical protein